MSLAALGIVSADLAASIKFYRALGVVFADDVDPSTGPHIEGKCPRTGLRIMFDSVDLVKKIQPQWVKPSGGAAISLCFEQSATTDVDAVFEAALAAGGSEKLKPWDAFWGQRYSSVLDPDGNQIDVYAELPAPPKTDADGAVAPSSQGKPLQPAAE
jgi:uncharacterized glyoxalase superfamily protein PhnB